MLTGHRTLQGYILHDNNIGVRLIIILGWGYSENMNEQWRLHNKLFSKTNSLLIGIIYL